MKLTPSPELNKVTKDFFTGHQKVAIIKGCIDDLFQTTVPRLANSYQKLLAWLNANTVQSYSLTPLVIVEATDARPIQIMTDKSHGLKTGNMVKISGVQDNTNANIIATVTVTDNHCFTLDGTAGNDKGKGGTIAVADFSPVDIYAALGDDADTVREWLSGVKALLNFIVSRPGVTDGNGKQITQQADSVEAGRYLPPGTLLWANGGRIKAATVSPGEGWARVDFAE